MFDDYEIIEFIIHLYKGDQCFILGHTDDFEAWIEAKYDLSTFEEKVDIDMGDSEFQNVMSVNWGLAKYVYYEMKFFNEYFNAIN